MNDKDCCGRCYYFVEHECRRYPPILMYWDDALSIGVFRFPIVRSDMYSCGEFKNNNAHFNNDCDVK